MAHWAYPGVKCVCVDDNFTLGPSTAHRLPMIGEVLTVVSVRAGVTGCNLYNPREASDVFLAFAEIPRNQGNTSDVQWNANAFRPLITKSQEDDVALFAPILNVRERQST